MNLLRSVLWLWLLPAVFFYRAQAISGQTNEACSKEIITIGLLISTPDFREAKLAAELAIDEANNTGDSSKVSYRLVTRSMEGTWGTGAKQTVDLVFQDKAWAIIGSHDGRNAHLAEQVAAKTQIPYISAWAGDPSLSQAYVPWYIGIAPTSAQEAKVLVDEILKKQKTENVIVLADDDYDSQMLGKFFLKEWESLNKDQPIYLSYNKTKPDLNTVIKSIKSKNAEAVVIFTTPDISVEIIKSIQEENRTIKIFGSLSLLGENNGSTFNLNDFEQVYLTNPGYLINKKGRLFTSSFEKEFGFTPSSQAAYTFDAVNLIIKTLRNCNFEIESFKQTIRETELSGITGEIGFNEIGNRNKLPTIIKIKNGMPQVVGN